MDWTLSPKSFSVNINWLNGIGLLTSLSHSHPGTGACVHTHTYPHTRTHTHTHAHTRTLTFRCAVEAYIAGNLSQASLALISPTILCSFEPVSFWSGPIIKYLPTSSNELQSLISVDARKVGNVLQVWYFPKVARDCADCRSYLIWLLQQNEEAGAFFRAASFQGIRGEEHHLCVFSDLHGNTAPSSSGFYTRDLIVLFTTWCNRIIFYGLILFYWWRRNAVTSRVMDGWKWWRSTSHDTTFPSCIQQTSLWINLVAWRQDVNREITGSAIWK